MKKRHRKASTWKAHVVTHIRKACSTRINYKTTSWLKDNLEQGENVQMLNDTCKIELIFRVNNKDEDAA